MTWEPQNLAAPEFATRSEPPAVCGILYLRRRHLISGVPESLKTLVALILGLEHVRAGHGPFALIDFESGPATVRRMLEDLGATLDEIASIYYVEPDAPPTPTGEDVDALVAAGVTLAIIDASAGAYDVSELDDNKRKDAETFGRAWIDPLWRRDVTTTLIDHVVKNSEARGKFAIGSERKAGRTDVHLGLEVVLPLSRGKTGLLRIVTHKDRPGWLTRPRAAEVELRSDPATHALTWKFKPVGDATGDADDWQPTVLMGRVSDYMAQHPAKTFSRNAICDAVTGKKTYLLRAIEELVQGGYLSEAEKPASGILHVKRFPVPNQFPPVPGNQDSTGSPVPTPSRGNRNGNRPDGTNNGSPVPHLGDFFDGAADDDGPTAEDLEWLTREETR